MTLRAFFCLAILPLAATANVTPTNALRYVAIPSFRIDSALPIVTGAVSNDPARAAATLAAARPDAPSNWYLRQLAVTNPPVSAPADPVRADVLVLPEGEYPVDRDDQALVEILLTDGGVCRGIVARYRRGVTAPTNLPIRVAHAGPAVGLVEDLYYVPGDGVWARISVEGSAAAATNAWRISPELFCLSHQAADDWGSWGVLRIPRYITGVALTVEPSIPALQRSEVSFGVPAGLYPKNHTPKHP